MTGEALLAAARSAAAGDPLGWLAFDARARSYYVDLEEFRPLAATVVDACHRDGRVRAAAIDAMHPAGLPLRAADWVAAVREPARARCRDLLAASPTVAVRTLGPLAYRLRDRAEGRWLVDALDAAIQAGGLDMVMAACSMADRVGRRIAFRAAIDAGRLPWSTLIQTANHDDDGVVADRCAVALVTSPAVARELLSAKHSSVRARALWAVGDADLARAALCDRSASVRMTAQALVRRKGGSPAAVYRDLVAGDARWQAIAGLGETGDRDDVDRLRAQLANPVPRAVVAAVRALRGLGDCPAPLLVPLLRADSPSVAKAAAASLAGTAVSLDLLAGLLEPDRPHHVRVAAYRLLGGHVWARLETGLTLVVDAADSLRDTAFDDVDRWIRWESVTAYAMPDEPIRRRLAPLVDAAETVLGEHRSARLRFLLGL